MGQNLDAKAVNQHVTNQPVAEKDNHWPRFKCRKCGAEFGSDEAAHEHRSVKRHWPRNISCQMCSKTFSTLDAAQDHLHALRHQGLKISCKMCLASFKTPEAAGRHMKDKNHLVL
jgi:5-methylcytosine-specific restriction endonuclease McrA